MMTAAFFMLFVGLIVFGPKKTVEMVQTIGRLLAQVNAATSKLQSQIGEQVHAQKGAATACPEKTTPAATSYLGILDSEGFWPKSIGGSVRSDNEAERSVEALHLS